MPQRDRLAHLLIFWGDRRQAWVASRTWSLSDAAWARIALLVPAASAKGGRPFREHRRVLEGIVWRYWTGSPWRDLPAEFAWNSDVVVPLIKRSAPENVRSAVIGQIGPARQREPMQKFQYRWVVETPDGRLLSPRDADREMTELERRQGSTRGESRECSNEGSWCVVSRPLFSSSRCARSARTAVRRVCDRAAGAA